MNFYDFFIFSGRFLFANLVLLFYLLKDDGNFSNSSSPVAQHLSLNIAAIRNIALRMKSAESLAENRASLNMKEALDDSSLRKLCTDLANTYWRIHNGQVWNSEAEKELTNYLGNFNLMNIDNRQICNPEDLVKFIDDALLSLNGENNSVLKSVY